MINNKTINIFCIDSQLITRILLGKFIENLREKYDNCLINYFHAETNEKAIKAIKQMDDVHILLLNQYREDETNAELDNELLKYKIYPLKIIFSAIEPKKKEKRYIDFILKPVSFDRFIDKISPVIDFVLKVSDYNNLSFSQHMASIPDFVIELGLENLIDYFENIQGNKTKSSQGRTLKNAFIKEEAKSISQGNNEDKPYWDSLSRKWKKLFYINHKLVLERKSYFNFRDNRGRPNICELFADDLKDINFDELPGIDNLRELEYFDCANMDLYDLEPLRYFTKLKFLDCSHNKIKSLEPVHQCMELEMLNCSYNPYLGNIYHVTYFPKLSSLLLHELPALKQTILPEVFEQLKYLAIAGSDIRFTQHTAENLIELYADYTNIPPLYYKKLRTLKIKRGCGQNKFPEEWKFYAPINSSGITIEIQNDEADNESVNYLDETINLLFIRKDDLQKIIGSKIILPRIVITDDIFDKERSVQKYPKQYWVGLDSYLSYLGKIGTYEVPETNKEKQSDTEVFDTAVKKQYKKWKGYANYKSSKRKKILAKIQTLDFSDIEFKYFPKEISECTNLRSLNLIDNPIHDFDDCYEKIKDLSYLTDLKVMIFSTDLDKVGNLCWSKITGIRIAPIAEFPRPSSLDRLGLPEIVLQQRHLTYLDLCNYPETGSVPYFSDDFFKLTKLEYLNLCDCSLSECLDPRFGKLTNLVELNLSLNEIKRLPKEMKNLVNLKKLHLSGGCLEMSDEELKELLPNCEIL